LVHLTQKSLQTPISDIPVLCSAPGSHPPENEPIMIVTQSLNTTGDDRPCRADHHLTIDRDGVDMQAHLRHLATILTISGDIDARNIDRVSAYATRLVPVGNALLLDLSGVDFFAAQSISMLVAVEATCRGAELPWALITSHAVDRVLRISEDDDIIPAASSVPDAMQYFADLARMRQQVPFSATRPSAPGLRSMSLERSAGTRRNQPPAAVLGQCPPITPITFGDDLADISQPTSWLPQS
jgi:anti-anti-sigma factor